MSVRALTVAVCACLAGAAPVASAETVSPEVQLCLQHLRPGEKVRAEKALGRLEQLPLYRVQLEVDPETSRVTGKVQVDYPARDQSLHHLFLRVTPNAHGERVTLSHASINGQPVALNHPEPTLYEVKLDPVVPAGASVLLDVAVAAKIPAGAADQSLLSGLGGGPKGDYGAFSATPEMISLVGIIPLVPPLDPDGVPFPGPTGVGDLALFAPAQVMASITVPAGYQVFATGEPLGEVPDPNGKVRFAFAAAAVRDFPVFVGRGYDVQTRAVEDLTIESYASHADAQVSTQVLGYAVAAVTELQRRLGPLPYKRLKVVEAPLTGGAGGMEFPGLITISTALFRGVDNPLSAVMGTQMSGLLGTLLNSPGFQGALDGPQVSKTLSETLEFTVAHEVAHQYFAGLVGSDPIRDPVVDESLAQYVALLYIEWQHGKPVAESFRSKMLVGSYQLYRLGGGADGAAARSTGDFASGTEYAALVYGKAPLLHQQERKLMGDAAFLKGLRAYVDQYRYKWAKADSLTQVLGKQSPGSAAKLEALRRRWWLEKHGDEDLGAPSLGSMVQSMTGAPLDPEMAKMIEQLMPQLTGQDDPAATP